MYSAAFATHTWGRARTGWPTGMQTGTHEPHNEKNLSSGLRPGKTQTRLLSYRGLLESWYFGLSKYIYCTISAVNNKGTDQTACMCRLICLFVVYIWQNQVFSWHGPHHRQSAVYIVMALNLLHAILHNRYRLPLDFFSNIISFSYFLECQNPDFFSFSNSQFHLTNF